MPLIYLPKSAPKKAKQAAARHNIKVEERAGRPKKQAEAIGLRAAGLSRKGGKHHGR